MTWPSRITSRYFSPQHHWVFPSFCFHNNRSRDSGTLSIVSEKLALKPLFLLLRNKRLIKLIQQHETWFPSNCFCTPELMTCSCPSREPVLRWMDTEEDICLTGHLSASVCAYLEAGAFITRGVLTSKNAHKLSDVYLARSKCHRKGILQRVWEISGLEIPQNRLS